ncbi:MAG: serine/threonine protein kinase [Deltaproteobacteria bacterium]|nr:serine/threonine protein kinase [Deltaproteobacteria bacterium]
MLRIGQTIERFAVEDYLGHGGMAVVYRVRHLQLGSLHALKILTVPRPSVRERLLKEGRTQAALRHPNLVAVTDVIDVGGSPALVMEYVDGPTMERWLARFRPTLAEALAIARGICAGVGEAHHHGLVHRDLKPGNVLLARTSKGFIPKVTDFGIARILEESELMSTTASNVAMGTPHYMAPEQIRDAHNADRRADVFSIGGVLYELVTGERAFPGQDVLTVLNAVAEGRYLPPGTHVPDLPASVIQTIKGCLLVDPEARFQTCEAVVEALGEVAGAGVMVEQGLDLPDIDYEDADLRRARNEWLATAPPASQRQVSPGPPATIGSTGEVETVEPTHQRPVALDSDAPSSLVSSIAETAPRAVTRHYTPPGSDERTAPIVLPLRRGLFRRLVVSAVFGVLLGVVVVLVWVILFGWPGQPATPPPEPVRELDEVMGVPH